MRKGAGGRKIGQLLFFYREEKFRFPGWLPVDSGLVIFLHGGFFSAIIGGKQKSRLLSLNLIEGTS
jgi:hypothetical protein